MKLAQYTFQYLSLTFPYQGLDVRHRPIVPKAVSEKAAFSKNCLFLDVFGYAIFTAFRMILQNLQNVIIPLILSCRIARG